MQSSRAPAIWVTISGVTLVAGGLSWLAKLAVIVATDGRVTVTGAAGAFFTIGIILLLIGSSGVGMWFMRDKDAGSRIAGIFLSVAGFLAAFMLLQGVAVGLWAVGQAAFGEFAPVYVRDEVAILVAAVAGLVVGAILMLRSTSELLHSPTPGASTQPAGEASEVDARS